VPGVLAGKRTGPRRALEYANAWRVEPHVGLDRSPQTPAHTVQFKCCSEKRGGVALWERTERLSNVRVGLGDAPTLRKVLFRGLHFDE
jgi:hypothetical protein